jgi:hypothetical protein
VTETTTTTSETTGTVTDFTPGRHLFLKTEADQPVRYKFSKTVTYVTSDGKVIEASQIKKDSKVRVHYVKRQPLPHSCALRSELSNVVYIR